jgi:hypothetical protein
MATTGKKRIVVEYDVESEQRVKTFKSIVALEGVTMTEKILELIQKFNTNR